ncbi:MAG: chromosomal replication initiator protein DnaA [Candidatus Omnitrophica bacterium]|nr:chromosomal replication initiator protein DnaA [Candidatus Omnitrophota bacterium]
MDEKAYTGGSPRLFVVRLGHGRRRVGLSQACAKRVETVQNPPFDWLGALESLKTRLGTEVVGRWLVPLSVASVTDDVVVLEAPNGFFRDWVAAHYLDALRSCAGGRALQVVAASIASVPASSSSARPSTALLSEEPGGAQALGPLTPQPEEGRGLNRRFTFDRFVVGSSNRFAHAASLAVAESPAKAYNPLFIYGGVGLGKTHLMQAIGQAILQRWPTRRVVYSSSERFTNELIAAIQTKTTTRFRDRYRTVDVLLVDDIHFIAQKEATQEEFFHTFNALYDAHKQIVISSDRSPKEIAGLEERLVSRFEWGLVTDIQLPDLETRAAILRKKAEESGVGVPETVTDFIAQQITSNIRELEGALIRVVAYCNLFNEPLTAATAQLVLKDMVREVRSRITLEDIQRRVAEYFQIEVGVLCGVKRERSILYPRQVAMFLCRRLTDASLPEIGRAFGGKDHTTVLHAVEKIEVEISQDLHKKQLIEHLHQLVRSPSDVVRAGS